MTALFVSLLGWLPLPLQLAGAGIIALFFFVTALHLVRFILDIIPFL